MIYEGLRKARKEEGLEVRRKRAGDFADVGLIQTATRSKLSINKVHKTMIIRMDLK